MKNSKRLVTLLLALVMLVGMFTVAASATEPATVLTLNFDTGNFYCADQDGIEAYEILKKHFSLCHTKDWAIASEGGFVKPDGTHLVDCIHGTGIVPMEEMMQLLKRDNYKGWAVIEPGGEGINAKVEADVALIKKYS